MMRRTELKRTPFKTSTTKKTTPAPLKLPAAEPKRRTRKCKICREPFEPRSMTQKVCGAACAETLALQDKARKLRMERQAGLAKLKRRADYLKEAQTAFNAWVRLRDDALPCICCGKFSDSTASVGGKWDAGHYLSRGSHPHLRFDERNVFKQRKGCNRPGGTTAASFRLGVIARIGLDAVEALESSQAPAKWTVDELKAIKADYTARLKQMKKDLA
jgi:hypothetical protein